jgi:hypothetical protein
LRQYPVYVAGSAYRGSDAKKRQKAENYSRVAVRVQEYLNRLVEKWADDSMGSILSYQVAAAIGEDSDLVHRIISGIDGGANGVTIYKGDYERALSRKPRSPDNEGAC